MIFSLAICNNVRVEDIDGEKTFNASSPDEIAMVEYFEELGYRFVERDETRIKFYDPQEKLHSYKILKLFPFESSRKRMGIIVKKENQIEEEENLIFYLKGADNIMGKKMKVLTDKILIEEKTIVLAKKGLRTLCFGSKKLSLKEFNDFEKKFANNLLNRDKHFED